MHSILEPRLGTSRAYTAIQRYISRAIALGMYLNIDRHELRFMYIVAEYFLVYIFIVNGAIIHRAC